MITSMEYSVRLDQRGTLLFLNEGLLRSTNTTECPCEIHIIKRKKGFVMIFFPPGTKEEAVL